MQLGYMAVAGALSGNVAQTETNLVNIIGTHYGVRVMTSGSVDKRTSEAPSMIYLNSPSPSL